MLQFSRVPYTINQKDILRHKKKNFPINQAEWRAIVNQGIDIVFLSNTHTILVECK